jgi:hypothetical protein
MIQLLFLGLPALLAAQAPAVEASPLRATEIAVCRDVVDRGCDSEGRTFGPDVENVAFLTKVEGATGEAFVFHVWSFEGKEVRRVKLPLRASPYRTWSSKRVKEQPGRWRVEVLDPIGRSLGVVDFTVQPPKID